MKESFSKLYARLYSENIQELEMLREKEKKKTLTVILIIMLVMLVAFVFPFLLSIIIPIGSIILIRYIVKTFRNPVKKDPNKPQEKTYRDIFKEKIVGPIIENTFEGAKYDAEKGLSRHEYVKAGYKDHMDRYSSDDLIIAPLKLSNEIVTSIMFAEVHTEREHRDEDGHRSYSTIFHGLAGSFLLSKNTENDIYIRTNGRVGNWNKNKVKMDMPEFEKIFDVEGTDAILAMRILTADVMAEMIDLYRKYKYRFEIHILQDTVHMRLSTGAMFEPSIFKNAMEYQSIEKYYLVLKALTNLAAHIYDTISKLEI